jgi:gliding motility-associated-like protein
MCVCFTHIICNAMKKASAGLLGLLILLLLSTNFSKASHVMGSDIQFTCLGNGKYLVTLKVYRDCNGVALTNSPIKITPVGCNAASKDVYLDPDTVIDITPVCSSVQSKCSGGSYDYGIEEHTFSGEIDLGTSQYANCCKFNITWNQCCRNTNITTGAGGCDFTTVATLDKCISPCNTSPQITNKPIAIICAGKDFCFNNGITDSIDGDSLSYEFADPLGTNGIPCPWAATYTKDMPLSFVGKPIKTANLPAGFHLDPVTGDICFRPNKLEVGVMVIKVTEWRKINGVLTNIGETRRDMQVIVTNCNNNNSPTLPSITKDACANTPICFPIPSADQDAADTVRVEWNKGIKGATFTKSWGTGAGGKKQRGTFCWTPTDADVRTNPYYFTVSARDDACPINATTVKAYSITVYPTPRATRTITKQKCGTVDFEITPLTNYGTLDYQWKIKSGINVVGSSTSPSFTHKFSVPGRYIVHSSLKTSKSCIMDYFDTLDVDTFATVTLPSDTFVCTGKSFTIHAQTKYGHLPYKYTWEQGTAADTFPYLFVKPLSVTMYKLTITDSSGCVNSDSIVVDVKDLPPVTLGADRRICSDEAVELDAGPDYTYFWPHNSATTQKITASDSGEYSVQVTDTFGCFNADTMALKVNRPVVINNIPDVSICLYDSITLSGNGGDLYTWTNLGNQLSVSGKTIRVSPAQTVSFEIIAERTYAGVTCYARDTVKVTVNQPTPVFFPPYPAKCADATVFQLSATPSNGFGGTGVFSCPTCPAGSVSGNNFNASIAKSGDWNIHYTFTNNFGCVSTDSNTITVHPLPLVDAGSARKACLNAPPQVLDGIHHNPGTEKWICANCPSQAAISGNSASGWYFDPAIAGTGIFKLIYELTTDKGCRGYDSLMFEVLTIPVVEAGSLNNVCISEQQFEITPRAGASPSAGTWKGPGVVGQKYFNAAIAGEGTHILHYTFQAAGCEKSDSVTIVVNKMPVVAAGADLKLCSNSPVYALAGIADGNINPPGSKWLCPTCPAGNDPVTWNTFDPSYLGTDSIRIYGLVFEYTDPVTGCFSSGQKTVTVRQMPTLSIEHREAVCQGTEFKVTGYFTGTSGIRWNSRENDAAKHFGNYRSPSTTYTPNDTLLSTWVSLTTDSIEGCPELTEIMNLNIYPTPSASILIDNDSGCVPLRVNLVPVTNAGQGATFRWKFGEQPTAGSVSENASYLYTKAGSWNVSLEVTSIYGCKNSPVMQTVVVHPLPLAAFTYTPEYITVALPKVQFLNETKGAKSFHWKFGDQENSSSDHLNPVFTYLSDTATYLVELSAASEYGCRDSVTKPLRINPDITIFIPNAFTPNNAGHPRNDRFYVDAEGITDYNLIIFNRWGEIIFRSKDRFEGWDGTYNLQPCQQDVYVYKLDVISYEGKPYSYSGTITLLR